ncbi:MAG: transglutaminase-like domain-containing protein [Planctomycetota bacterium]|jgi:transglutaminase-like putative cysteine protease
MPRKTATTAFCACLLLAGGLRAAEVQPPKLTPQLLEKLCGEEWGGLYASGKKAGYMHSVVKVEKRDSGDVVVVKSDVVMRMQYMGAVVEASGDSYHEYSAKTGKLLKLKSDTRMGGTVISSATISPDGDGFKRVALIAGKEHVTRMPGYRHTIQSVLGTRMLALTAGLKTGDTYTVETLKPDTGGAVRAVNTVKSVRKLPVSGVPVEVVEVQTRLYTVPPEGKPEPENPSPLAVMFTRVDTAGNLIEGTIIPPFTFRIEDEKSAKRMDRVSDVMSVTGVRPDKPIPNARSAKKVVLRLTGMPAESVVQTTRQKFEKHDEGGYVLTLTVDAPPKKAAPLSAGEKEKLAEYLKPTHFLQSDDPRIRKLAAETVGAETDPFRAAGMLGTWVSRNIKKKFTPMMSNALDTLKSRSGDCGEHAALFVALCRAAGIPAREIAGLAYTDELGEAVLGGHAWAEIYADGRWIAVDPTFKQEIADAVHIRVAEGGMNDSDGLIRLANLMGKLKVEVVSSE